LNKHPQEDEKTNFAPEEKAITPHHTTKSQKEKLCKWKIPYKK
jgi:hypothetical protein